ncbi:MAG: trehalose-phosphatase [Elusimicrobia bacterium]|nr:trehalose-phosphatase [Candidatus Liberimonas magnetica]
MKSLLENEKEVLKLMKNKSVVLFLDYDGTLVSLADTPKKAVLPGKVKSLLSALAKLPHVKIVIISGRYLNDVKKMAGLQNITYVGNHGLEIEGPDFIYKAEIAPDVKKLLIAMKSELKDKLSIIKGVLVEDKKLAVTLHYRMVNEKDMPQLNAIFNQLLKKPVKNGKLRIWLGKMCYEIRPSIELNKGTAVLRILSKYASDTSVIPICLGDDLTDEDAFMALKNIGITVFVGEKGSSHADYQLKNPDEVFAFLKSVKNMMCGGAYGPHKKSRLP